MVVRKTHRGPLISLDLMIGANQLYGHKFPNVEIDAVYSLKYGGQYPGENSIFMFEKAADGYGVKQFLDFLNSHENGYQGPGASCVLADNDGNIGYIML